MLYELSVLTNQERYNRHSTAHYITAPA